VFGARAETLGPLYWVGDLMQVGGGLCWALTTLYIKRLAASTRHTHYQTMFSQLFFSIPLLGVAWLVFQRGNPVMLSAPVVAAFVYQAVIIAFVSYLSWFWMIHHYSVSRLSSFTFLVPLFGVALSGLILRESIPLLLWVGLALVGAGIFLVNWPQASSSRA
jgi:drug/metabolite transporter (DMT)-like permease